MALRLEKLNNSKRFTIYRPYKDRGFYKCQVDLTAVNNSIYTISGIDEVQAIVLGAHKAFIELLNAENPEKLLEWLEKLDVGLYEVYIKFNNECNVEDLIQYLNQESWDIYRVYCRLQDIKLA